MIAINKALGRSVSLGLAGVNKGLSLIAGAVQRIAFYGGIAGAAFTAISYKIIKTGAEFEQAIVNTGIIAGQFEGGVDRTQALTDRARQLGATTAYTATEVAKGMGDLARAGLSVDKVIGSIEATLYLAGAAGAEMEQATKLMARTFAQFGLEAEEATRVADTFTIAMQNSLLDIESLDSSMRYAGAAAGAFGWDIEQTTAAVSLFMDQTGMGSTAGTQFRHVLLSLAGPTAAAQKIIKELAETQGVTYDVMRKRLNPATSDFATILENLKPIMKDHDKILKLVNKRSSGTLQKILKDYHSGASKYKDLMTMFETEQGKAQRDYEIQINTVSGQASILKSKLQEVFLSIFDGINPGLASVMKSLGVMLDQIIAVLKASVYDIQIALYDSFNVGNTGAASFNEKIQSMGTTIGLFIVKIIKGLAKIPGKLKSILQTLLSLAGLVAKIWLAAKFTTMVAGIVKITRALYAMAKAAQLAAAWNAIATGGITLLGGLLAGGVAGFGLMSMGSVDAATNLDNLSMSLDENTEAMKDRIKIQQELEKMYSKPLVRKYFGDDEDDVADSALGQENMETMQRIRGKTDDKQVLKAIDLQLDKSTKFRSSIDKGELFDIESELIPKEVTDKLKEMNEGKKFLATMDLIYATAESIDEKVLADLKNRMKTKLKIYAEQAKVIQEAKDTGFDSKKLFKDAEISLGVPQLDEIAHSIDAARLGKDGVTTFRYNTDDLKKIIIADGTDGLGIEAMMEGLVGLDPKTGEQIDLTTEQASSMFRVMQQQLFSADGTMYKDAEELKSMLKESVRESYTLTEAIFDDFRKSANEYKIDLTRMIDDSESGRTTLADLRGMSIEDIIGQDIEAMAFDRAKAKYGERTGYNKTLFDATVEQAKENLEKNKSIMQDFVNKLIEEKTTSEEDIEKNLHNRLGQDLRITDSEDLLNSLKDLIKSGYYGDAGNELIEEINKALEGDTETPLTNLDPFLRKSKVIATTIETLNKENEELEKIYKDSYGRKKQVYYEGDKTSELMKNYFDPLMLGIREAVKAGDIDEDEVKKIISNLTTLKGKLKQAEILKKDAAKQLFELQTTGSITISRKGGGTSTYSGETAQIQIMEDLARALEKNKDEFQGLKESIAETNPIFNTFLQKAEEYILSRETGFLSIFKRRMQEQNEEEERDQDRKDADRKAANQRHFSRLKSFYQKLYTMERKNKESVEKLQEKETDSLINALKRRIKKTKEFFEKGYRLQKRQSNRRLALRRREERLIDDLRLQAKLKVEKDARKRLETLENKLFEMDANDLQKLQKKRDDNNKKAKDQYEKDFNLIVEEGSTERIKILNDETKKLDAIFLNPIKNLDDRIQTYKRKFEKTTGVSILSLFGIKDDDTSKIKDIHSSFKEIAQQKRKLIATDKLTVEAENKINKELDAANDKRDEQISKLELVTDLLGRRAAGDTLDQFDFEAYSAQFMLTPEFVKASWENIQKITKKEAKGNLSIFESFLKQELKVYDANMEAIENANIDLNKDLSTIQKVYNKEKLKNQKEYAKAYHDTYIKPIEDMEKQLQELRGSDTEGERIRLERLAMEIEILEKGDYATRIKRYEQFLEKQKLLASKAAKEDFSGIDPFVEFSEMPASWILSRKKELELALTGGVEPNTLLQRALEIETKADSKDIFGLAMPESTKERLEEEAQALRQYAQMLRDHYAERKNILYLYNIDEAEAVQNQIDDLKSKYAENEVMSEEDQELLDFLVKKQDFINKGKEKYIELIKEQNVEEENAVDAAKKASNTFLKSLKGFAEKAKQYWMTAFGPLYVAYEVLMAIKNVLKGVIDKIKGGLDWFTGGNLELNPFKLISEAAAKLIEQMDELADKQKELDDQFKAGRITQDEYIANKQKLKSEKANAKEVAKETIDTMVNDSIRFMEAIVKVAPLVLDELVRQLPKLMKALEEMIPKLLRILDEMLPVITPVLIKIFTVAAKVFAEVVASLLGEWFKGWLNPFASEDKSKPAKSGLAGVLGGAVGLLLTGMNPLGMIAGGMVASSLATKYGDTPGPVRVTNSGLLARFAPGDTVIAAQEPQELLRQALTAVGSEVKMGTRRPPPSPPSSSATQGSGGSRIDIAVIAEGRVLDAVQMQAMERGHAPKIAKRLRKASGVKVGFNRGRYNKFAVNQS